ncbi:40S ribosomal protein S4 [Zea mays]|uniref:40S ribosomal protein S4 n=1 Tax=Zea mays TaxID=4577 RepID=A0A3L6ECG5_MAIZE|nr:40S ribosomal protein S4 [Zea mays]
MREVFLTGATSKLHHALPLQEEDQSLDVHGVVGEVPEDPEGGAAGVPAVPRAGDQVPGRTELQGQKGRHEQQIPLHGLKLGFVMARGLKKHLKRLNAPKHWMLNKLGRAFAPKPSSGPHKSRECLPLILIIRNRLKYALTYREMSFPSLRQTRTIGCFRLHPIRDEDAKFMLCKVGSVQFGQKGIPYLNTYGDRTIRYPDPLIKANDTNKIDLETNKIMDFIKFDVGNVVMVTGGRNTGRVGVIKNREKHKGSFETIHVLLGAFCYV